VNKNEFIKALEANLEGIPAADKSEILYDYEEHFRMGMEQGKTEEQVAEALGNPRTIGKQFRATVAVEQAQTNASTGNILRAVVAVISLGFFNLVFVLGPFMGIVGVLIGIFAAAGAFVVAGLAVLVSAFAFPLVGPYLSLPSFFLANPIGLIALSLGLTSLGLLLFIGNFYLAKLFYRLTVKYLKMNIRIINGGGI